MCIRDSSSTVPVAENPGLSIVELRAFVAERSTPENRPKIKAILERHGVRTVSYTHLDVYKRQVYETPGHPAGGVCARAVYLGGVLPRQRPASDARHGAVGVHRQLAPGQTGVRRRAAQHLSLIHISASGTTP